MIPRLSRLDAFALARSPELVYGAQAASRIPKLAIRFGRRALIVTGSSSLDTSGVWRRLEDGFRAEEIAWSRLRIAGEPSPTIVDAAVVEAIRDNVEVVVAIGGGSALDAGKAISAMIPSGRSVLSHLEGLPGAEPHDGRKIPFIAAPTTAGTGSEATKNAVLSEIGAAGFKRSLRHDNLVPEIAVLDPALMISCPVSATAAGGMDAFTQLLEGYVSPRASPITDALAMMGLRLVAENLIKVCEEGAGDLNARGAMAIGAYCSGFVLAHAGLGIVHGLAGPIGGRWSAPHGMICGTLLHSSVEMNIKALKRSDSGSLALEKYAAVGALFADDAAASENVSDNCDILLERLREWTVRLPLTRLSSYGITEDDITRLAEKPDLKQNPVALSSDETAAILRARL